MLRAEDIGFEVRDATVLDGFRTLVILCHKKSYVLVDLAAGRRVELGATQELSAPIVSACFTKSACIWLSLEDGSIVVINSHTGQKKCTISTLAGVSIRQLQAIVERNCVAAIVDDGIMLFAASSHVPFAFLEPPFQSAQPQAFLSVSSERYLNENPSGVSSSTIYAITSSSTLCIWSLFFSVPL